MAFRNFVRMGAAAAVTSIMLACGSSSDDPFGPEPSYADIKAQFDHPTGTFAAGSEKSIFSTYDGQANANTAYNVLGSQTGSSTPSTTMQASHGLRILGGVGNASTWCGALQQGQASGSCGCPQGGTFVYDLSGIEQARQQSGVVDVTAKLRFEACAVDQATVDGREFLHMHADSSAGGQLADFYMLLDAHLTATAPDQKATIDLEALFDNGGFWASIKVNDGNVAVATTTGGTQNGKVVVKDRNETWTCALTNGAGTCTSDKGGSRQIM